MNKDIRRNPFKVNVKQQRQFEKGLKRLEKNKENKWLKSRMIDIPDELEDDNREERHRWFSAVV